jgi:hypothetical protein
MCGWVTSPAVQGRSGSGEVSQFGGGKGMGGERTMGGHAVREDRVELVGRHGAVGYEGVQEGTVHICVALVGRHVAHEG